MKLFLALFFTLAAATTYFSENFEDGWESRWIQSNWKSESERGALKSTVGIHGDGKNHGVQTSEDARFYTYSAKIPKSFSNKGKTVIFQYTVKHEQSLDCGGSYLKFLPGPIDQANFKGGEGENKYNIMFGPDWCGGGMKRVHAIFNYDGKNHLLERNTLRVPAEPHVTHMFSLYVHPNNSYSIYIDNVLEQYGALTDRPDYTILPEREIPDPAVSKPSDWVDDPEMDDPNDKKPEGYDDIPATIADPEAKKPDDWDDELDGEWEAPQIANPEYKGEWKPKRIPNPGYKGPWSHPLIPNPDFKIPENLYAYDDFSYVGIEIWQVKSGTVFDNILITDDAAEASAAWDKLSSFRQAEAASLKKAQEEEAAKAKAEEEARKAEDEAKKADDSSDSKENKDEL